MTMNTSFLLNSEYNFLRENKYLGDNIILLGLGGSHAYGTNTEGSDIDVRGIATRSSTDICLGRDFEEITNNITDTVIYSFDKMLKLLAECNPNCIEMLGLRPQDYLQIYPIGSELLNNRELFISQHCIKTFGGYANQQLYRLQQKTLAALTPEEFNEHIAKTINGMSEHLEKSWGIKDIVIHDCKGKLIVDIPEMKDIPLESFYGITNEIGNVIKEYNKNSTRNNKAIEHGKINKHAMHLLRLYMMAIDLLNGEIITYREAEHDLLMDIRNGKYTGADGLVGKEFFDILKEYEIKFEEAKKNTKIPEHPDYEGIMKLQEKVNTRIVVEENDHSLYDMTTFFKENNIEDIER